MEPRIAWAPAFALGFCLAAASSAAPLVDVFSAAGDVATVTAERNAFRDAIGGGIVAGPAGSFGGVRREINWDAVPAAFSDPNLLPPNFFNVNSPRGVVFTTPGTGFVVSANAGDAVPVEFGFGDSLGVFSPQKLFAPLNSNVTGVDFFLPGTATRAATTAFGAIFTDVDVPGSTRIAFFDINDTLLFAADVPASGGDEAFSFLGITVSGGSIGSVRITSGTATIAANGLLGVSGDLVAMDDFLYAEPQLAARVPSAGTLILAIIGLLAMRLQRRARYGSPGVRANE